MVNWSALTKDDALAALAERRGASAAERARLGAIQFDQPPLLGHVEELFEHALGQLAAEAEWVERTLAYMNTKPWLE